MTDEPRPEETGTPTEATAVAAPETETAEKKPAKLSQTVEISDIGPCKKHIKVTIARVDIDARFHTKFSELVGDANVPGFRPGKAPRKVIERRFHKDVGDQIKSEMLLASLEQLAEEHDLAPLNSPNINPSTIELPDSGPMIYEFEVEVRPQFDLPNYKGLRLRRPVHTYTTEEVIEEERRILASDGQVVPKPEGQAHIGDVLIAEVVFRHGGAEVGRMEETAFRVDRQLAFKDGVADRFAEQVKDANPGDKRTVDVRLSQATADPKLRGQTVQALFDIKDVKTLRLPALTPEYLRKFGVTTPEMLREMIQVFLQKRLEHTQRQAAREQIIQQLAVSQSWDLPQDLLQRQAGRALSRRRLEMQADGIPEKEIQDRLRLLQQDVLQTTALSLKEHFVLQKIAELEKIDVQEDDINDEIERLANQQHESPRRLRARLEKEDALDSLVAEMYERKAVDLILDHAEYEDVELVGQQGAAPAMSSIEAQAVPGQMNDPSVAVPTEETPASPS